MYDFTYHRPKTLAEAASLLSSIGDAKLLAGGHTLIPTMKQRLASPSDLIDLADVSELRGVSVNGDTVSIGAGVTHAEVASSADVTKAIPALAKLAGGIGDPHVRHRGTIGGSIANNDPSADYPAACLGLGASIHTNKGSYKADDFFTGMFETALAEDEIITRIDFPAPKKAAYMKFANPASRYALVGVMVAEAADGIRVAVTGAGPCVFRAAEVEAALRESFTPEAAKGAAISPDGLTSDIHASAEYRAHLVSVMAARAVAACG